MLLIPIFLIILVFISVSLAHLVLYFSLFLVNSTNLPVTGVIA